MRCGYLIALLLHRTALMSNNYYGIHARFIILQ